MADQILQATALSVTCCALGTISIHFHGLDGHVFAIASMDKETALDAVDLILDRIEEHESAGHA
jgi:hypothetical protein